MENILEFEDLSDHCMSESENENDFEEFMAELENAREAHSGDAIPEREARSRSRSSRVLRSNRVGHTVWEEVTSGTADSGGSVVYHMPDPAGASSASGHLIAPAKANQVILRGRVFTRLLKNHGTELSGYSLQCPTCCVSKDLHHVNSDMGEEEALNRLERLADSCREGHKRWGGRLLILCAS